MQPRKSSNVRNLWPNLKNRGTCTIKMSINKVTPMAMPPEDVRNSTNLCMCPRCLHPTTSLPQRKHCQPTVETDSLKMHAPAFNSKIDEVPQIPIEKRCDFQCGVKKVNEPNTAFAQCQSYHSPERKNPFPKNLVVLPHYSVTYPLLFIPFTFM